MFSFLNKDSLTGFMSSVAEVGSRIKASVEQVAESTLGDFAKEQQKFVASKQHDNAVGALPWTGCKHEAEVEAQVIALSSDRRNVLRDPPAGARTFAFDVSQSVGVAQSMLDVDERLRALRFELVPKTITEERFWRNYFYRVNLIRAAAEHPDASAPAAAAAAAAVAAEHGDSEHHSGGAAAAAATSTSDSSTNVPHAPTAAPHPAHSPAAAAPHPAHSPAAAAIGPAGIVEDNSADHDETASNASFAEKEPDSELQGDLTADLEQLGLAVSPNVAAKDEPSNSKAESLEGKARSDDFDLLDEDLQAELASLGTDEQSAAAIDAEIDTMLKDA